MSESRSKPMINANCCHLLQRAIREDKYPIFYDFEVEEVQLQGVDSWVTTFHYCPFCGQKLESGRSTLFLEISDEDRNDVQSKLEGLISLKAVLDVLGPQDSDGLGGGPELRPWKRFLRYEKTWSSIVLIVGEHHDGVISWVLAPKLKTDNWKQNSRRKG